MEKELYIVHCVDTEGPLDESLDATFEMIENIFSVKIEPSIENLKKLNRKELDLGGLENEVAELVSDSRLYFNRNWNDIRGMLDEICSGEFRLKLPDSAGNGWIYNWFCMDHCGFNEINPRHRDAGIHNVFDFYRGYFKNHGQDLIQMHYHPLSINRNFHSCGTAYVSNNSFFNILSRKIIDRSWFPAVYRPGFHTERPDSHWILEQWIPFDYANQAMKKDDKKQPDLIDGRFGDWRSATTEWEIYHPSHEDYQKKGACKRWIARCLNMETRLREITLDDIKDGFERADKGLPAIVSFTDHDFRNMRYDVEKLRKMIESASKEYPDVKFYYVDAIEAIRRYLKQKPSAPGLEMELNGDCLRVKAKGEIFGTQPFLALKTLEGNYYWDNFDFQGNQEWTYTFDSNTLPLRCIEKIGAAINSPSAVTEVVVYDAAGNTAKKTVLNK